MSGAGEKGATDRVGAILQIKGKTCKLMGPARETFDSPIDLSKSALVDLANNAVCRYSSASATMPRSWRHCGASEFG